SRDWHPANVLRFLGVILGAAALAATLLLALYAACGFLGLPSGHSLPQLWLGLTLAQALGAFVLLPWLAKVAPEGGWLGWLVPAVAVLPLLSLGQVTPVLVVLALPVAAWLVVRGGFAAAAGVLLGGMLGAFAMQAAGLPPLPLGDGAIAYAHWALLLLAAGLPLLLLGSAFDDYRAQTAELEQRVAERTGELQSALADARFLITNDLLTGALNRRHAMTVIDRELARAERYPQPLSAVLFIIDDFSRIQDTHGSRAADVILQELSGLVQAVLRGSDMLVRWDDAQFLALLPQTGFDDAQIAAQKVRHAVARHDFRTQQALLISLGVAAHRPGESRGDWLTRVEQALFQAQADGGDRTIALN
ncbi:MAG TPA: GGDEF domain-containing protein, partial [Arenimonas sp.]|nr:GGDEF domain-containing protein [Arenimonas sp.]